MSSTSPALRRTSAVSPESTCPAGVASARVGTASPSAKVAVLFTVPPLGCARCPCTSRACNAGTRSRALALFVGGGSAFATGREVLGGRARGRARQGAGRARPRLAAWEADDYGLKVRPRRLVPDGACCRPKQKEEAHGDWRSEVVQRREGLRFHHPGRRR